MQAPAFDEELTGADRLGRRTARYVHIQGRPGDIMGVGEKESPPNRRENDDVVPTPDRSEMTRVQIKCSIADDLRKQIQDRLYGPVQKQRSPITLLALIMICINSVLQLIWCITGHRSTNVVFFVVMLVYALGMIGGWLALPYLPRRWPYAAQIAIAIDDTGITGKLDGKAVSFCWHDVTSIEDIDDAFMMYFGEGPFARRLVIPKVAVPDPAGLWAQLDDRLVSKRGLSGPRSKKRIVNTAFA